jgi:hypothetical protein
MGVAMKLYCFPGMDKMGVPPNLWDDVLYLMSTVYTRPIYYRELRINNPDKKVNLKANILQRYMKDYKGAIEYCREKGWLGVNRKYEPHGYCRQYWLKPPFNKMRWQVWGERITTRERKLGIDPGDYEINSDTPIIAYLRQSLYRLTVEITEREIDELKKLAIIKYLMGEWKNRDDDRYEDELQQIIDKDPRIKPDDFGRIHTNISSMSGVLRKYLRLDGQIMEYIDMPNFQPLLMVLMFKNNMGKILKDSNLSYFLFFLTSTISSSCSYSSIHDIVLLYTKEINEWLSYCEKGKLYHHLQDISGLSYLDKDPFKGKVFFPVLYGMEGAVAKDKQIESLRQAMRLYYPLLWGTMELYKKKGKSWGDCKCRHKNGGSHTYKGDNSHACLATSMQTAEAEFIYNKVGERVKRELKTPIITIHDCINCIQGMGESIKAIVQEEFMRMKVNPILEVKQYE